MARKLTSAQERMLLELYPPAENAEGRWYFRTVRARVTMKILAHHGLVDMYEDGDATGAKLTPAGYRHIGQEFL